jgi:hypothetical protein
MSASTSRLSFQDCFDVMEKAIESERGVRVQFETEGAAKHFLVRLNKARVLDRDENRQTYVPGDMLFGRSVYDPLMGQIRRVDGTVWLFINKLSAEHLVIEDIDGTELVDSQPRVEITVGSPAEPVKVRRL